MIVYVADGLWWQVPLDNLVRTAKQHQIMLEKKVDAVMEGVKASMGSDSQAGMDGKLKEAEGMLDSLIVQVPLVFRAQKLELILILTLTRCHALYSFANQWLVFAACHCHCINLTMSCWQTQHKSQKNMVG